MIYRVSEGKDAVCVIFSLVRYIDYVYSIVLFHGGGVGELLIEYAVDRVHLLF